MSLRGHTQVAAVRFLPNGRLVTAGDTTMRMWHPETGKTEKVWKFSHSVETCCCSPDGRYIACGVVDGLVFVFDVRSQQQVAVWEAHTNCRQGPLVQFYKDSAYLVSAAGFTCKIWSAQTSKLLNTWDTTLVTSLKIAKDHSILAVGSNTGIVTTHELPDGISTQRLHAHRSEVWALDFSPSRPVLATAGDEDGIKLWDTESWEMIQLLRGHTGVVLDCGFSFDGSQLLTCGMDQTLQLWGVYGPDAKRDPHRGTGSWQRENVLVGHHDVVLSCVFAPPSGSQVVASGARDGTTRAWRLADVPRFTSADASNGGVAVA